MSLEDHERRITLVEERLNVEAGLRANRDASEHNKQIARLRLEHDAHLDRLEHGMSTALDRLATIVGLLDRLTAPPMSPDMPGDERAESLRHYDAEIARLRTACAPEKALHSWHQARAVAAASQPGVNQTAQLLRAIGPTQTPMIRIAGVTVAVYVDPTDRLVIAAAFDDSELGDPTPVTVQMSGVTVWQG